MRKLYSAVTKTPASTQTQANPAPGSVEWRTASMSDSLEKKPANPGVPIRARVPMSEVIQVIGMYLRKPPILRMSCSWCIAMITEPAARNSSALKKAWVPRWKMLAAYADAPSPTVM